MDLANPTGLSHLAATIWNMCSVCDEFEARMAAGTVVGPDGAVAQLVERFHGMEEVARSIRVGSTSPPEHFMLAGFAAGEGSFSITTRRPPFKDGTPRLRFCFDVTVAARDRQMLERLRDVLGFGSIADRHPLRAGWQPTSELRIASMHAHKTATIPFFDSFLPVSNKRAQYEHWRDALLAWDEEHPSRFGRGPSPCSVEGCTRPVRGRDLCRRHYYRVTGY